MSEVKIALSVEEYEALMVRLDQLSARAEFFERAALQYQDELSKLK